MPIRGTGPHSLVRGNFLQCVIGDLVVWELVVLLVNTFNTLSSVCAFV